MFNENFWRIDYSGTLPFFVLDAVGITYPDCSYCIRRAQGVDFYTFEYVVSGRGSIEFENKTLQPQPGDMYILPRNVPVSYRADRQDPWKKLWINLGGALPENLLNIYDLQGVDHLPGCPVRKEFEQIIEIVRVNGENAPRLFAEAFHRLISAAGWYYRNRGRSENSLLAQKLRHYCEQNWQKNIRLPELAGVIQRSPVQTVRIFEKEFHCTPAEWLRQYKLSFIKQYLLNTNCTLSVIAGLTGFKDEFYFANYFKKYTGVAPGKFRKDNGR